MKKFISIAAAVITLSMTASGVAAIDYTTTYHSDMNTEYPNSVSSDYTSKSRTVLVIKGETIPDNINTEDIVYIGQAPGQETAFEESTHFFLPNNVADGIYTIIFENGESKKLAKGIGEVVHDVELTHLADSDELADPDEISVDKTYKMGFVYDTATLNMADYQNILITFGADTDNDYKVLKYEVPTVFTGDTQARIGIQLNRIPTDIYTQYKDSIKIYLRPILNK